VIRGETVRDLRLVENNNTVLTLPNLERLSLVEPGSLLHMACPAEFRAQVRIVSLRPGLRLWLKSPLAEFLHTVEWRPNPELRNSLTLMLSLPRLKRMVVHNGINFHTKASPTSKLQELVLVDCWNMSLAFMDDLPLRSLGLVQHELDRVVWPADVPKATRARILQLEVRWRSFDLRGTSVSGYSNLRWLSVSSPRDVGCTLGLSSLIDDIQALSGLETLRLDAVLPLADLTGLALTSLDIASDAYFGLQDSTLRDLALTLGADSDSDTDLRRCTGLRRLRLVRGQRREKWNVLLPESGALQVLELVDLRPWGDLKVPTLYVDRRAFVLMDADEQARLKASVPNLYVLSTTRKSQGCPQSCYFQSSFISD
jgi:hypothetical protein